ncbi:alpha/beta hydrolase [Streptomyces sp. NPDC005012]|uniref:alpha/beta hydrolase n=1 Tax=unclassified Streptomyces TaxID=2593676 RepID=UPI0033A4F874
MPLLATPPVAATAARAMQAAVRLADRYGRRGPGAVAARRFPEHPRNASVVTVPTTVAPARAAVYRPPGEEDTALPVHVNFHGGGFVLPLTAMDDAFCRFLAAEAGVVVVNVDYVLAPQHPFPAPVHQAYEVVRRVAESGAEHGWDGGRLTVGGHSAGGSLAAAVSRLAFEKGGPEIALQVLHYPALDLATGSRAKPAAVPRPALRPWQCDVFNGSYTPDPRLRTDRLASPAHPADTADLRGIAPAVIVTAEHDLLHDEAVRYAERLRSVDALVEHHDVPGVDHGYDVRDEALAREVYALMARRVREAAKA